jgi:hypothetical protein
MKTFKQGDVVLVTAVVITPFTQTNGEGRLQLTPIGEPHIDFFASAKDVELIQPVLDVGDLVLVKGDSNKWRIRSIQDKLAWITSHWGERVLAFAELQRAEPEEPANG